MNKQPVLSFACQSMFLTVGQPDGFATLEDYLRFTADCGFEGVTVPVGTPICEWDKLTTSTTYLDDLEARVIGMGMTAGVHNMEFHVVTQNCSLHPYRKNRFGSFMGEDFAGLTAAALQSRAHQQLRQLIDVLATRPAKQRKVVGFCGGRGYPTAQAKWSAWPKYLPEWILASLVCDWEADLEYAADRGVTIHFEIGHPENDILTGDNFRVFRNMLSPKARKGLGLQADRSHFHNTRINAMPHFLVASPEEPDEDGPVLVTNHYKDGYVIDRLDGTASAYGGWKPWSQASHSFATVGIFGSTAALQDFHVFNRARHLRQEGGNPIVYEAECVVLQNPKQAMRIGAQNCLALRDCGQLVRVHNFAPVAHESWLGEDWAFDTKPVIIKSSGELVAVESWAGGPFDAFADSPVKPYVLLGLNPDQTSAARAILERAGLPEAAAA